MHVVETFAGTAAGWLREKGLPADCGPASLACLDQFITDNAPEWGPMWEGDLRPEDVPQHSPMLRRVFALGCYIGKSLRRKHGGKWHWPDDPLFLELEFPNGSSVAPVWAVSMRLQYGWSVASFVHAAAVFAGGQGNDNRANDRSS